MATKATENTNTQTSSSPNTPTPPSSSCCKSLPNPDHPIPERTSSCCSRLLFTWFTPLTNIQITDQTDVWKTPKQDSSKTQTDLLEIKLQQQIDNGTDPKYQLLWALIYTRGWEWLLCSFLKLTGETAQYVMPVLLNELIGWMENKQGRDFTYPIMVSCILVGTMIFRTFVMAYYVNLTCRVGLTRRTAFMGVVINKSLELNSSTASINIGSLINILGNDAEKMSLGSRLFQNAWFQPVALMLCMSLLVHYIGVSAFVGFALMLVLLPCQVFLAKKLTKLRRLLLLKSDARISVVSNLVQGIRAIKLLTWEKFIMQDIDAKRTTELKSLRDFLLINLVNYMLLTSIPIFVAALTFWVYILLGNQLTASTAFTALSLLNMLRGPLFMFPRVLTAVLDGYVGIERAQRLLNMKKCQRYLFVKEKDVDKVGICIDNKSFDWNLVPELKLGKNVKKDANSQNVNVQQEGTKEVVGDEEMEVMAENSDSKTAVSLSNINLSLKHTQTGILLGAVGSGKSTLLQALLGECPLVTTNDTMQSTPMLHGSVAYVPQIPFIAQATVRENILFGRPFKLEFYDKCISVCALDTDLKLFPSGDATEIGERGINLSGGQKMRVALCRAMYSEAQIYLLDDPLAAVDANVAEHIWKYGIQEMLQDKIVLMATNAINYCKQVDQIYFVETTTSSSTATASNTNLGNGFSAKLTEQGTLKEIMAIKNGKLAAILAMASAAEDITEETTATTDVAVVSGVAVVVEEDADNNETAIRNRSRSRSISSQSVGGGLRSISTSSSNNGNNTITTNNNLPPSATTSKTKHEKKDLLDGKLITKENQESGSIKKRAWCAYFNAVGQSFCIIIMCIYVTRESARVGMELWMSSWSDVEALRHNAKDNMNNTNSSIVLNQSDPLSDPITSYYLYGYLIWAAVALFVAIVRSIFLLWASLRAAKKTFEGLISSIVHAPMFWYDTTPSGRILNRIASDTAQIDERVPSMLRDTTDSFIRIVGTLILVIIFTPWFCLLLPLVFVLFYDLQEKYRKTTRELKRFGSTTRSPIYNNFNGCLTGMTTIHAFNQLNHWIEKHHDGSDNNFRFGYLVLTASRWSAIRFEFISHVMIAFVCLYISLSNNMSPGLAGAALMNITLINRTLMNAVRNYIQLELGFNAVERIEHYTTELPQEDSKSDIKMGNVVPLNWPMQGTIQFTNFQLRYRQGLPLVLNNINLLIQGGEKIGIVGRTGSGKSTMALALFRMIEASAGSIEIDGYNILDMSLHTLRSRISIVPQVPTLFRGTLRFNLDPHRNCTDDFIWLCLKKCQLKSAIDVIGDGLQAKVDVGGINWSVGQRQLICLARALCQRSKVLILDECSASVDSTTDGILQDMIRTEFAKCTVLTIAHRLETVNHCDKVLVLNEGKVAEFESPEVLRKREGSIFKQMWELSQKE